MGEAHNYEYTIYDEEPKPHTKKNIFSKMAKTTRQRFTHSESSGLPNNSSLIFEKLGIYMLTP